MVDKSLRLYGAPDQVSALTLNIIFSRHTSYWMLELPTQSVDSQKRPYPFTLWQPLSP
jgi:hypothetical protein